MATAGLLGHTSPAHMVIWKLSLWGLLLILEVLKCIWHCSKVMVTTVLQDGVRVSDSYAIDCKTLW